MRKAKLFFSAILVLIGFLCLITVFLPSKITVSKSALINANEKVVAMQINDFKNWNNWYPAFKNENVHADIIEQKDTSMAILTNEKQEKITLVLLTSVPRNIRILVSDEKGNTKIYEFVLLPNGSGETQLTWNVDVKLAWYPWKKLTGLFLDKVIGPQYEVALQNLKKASEKNTP